MNLHTLPISALSDAIKDRLVSFSLLRSLYRSWHSAWALYFYLRGCYFQSLASACRIRRILNPSSDTSFSDRLYARLYQDYVLHDGQLSPLQENSVLRTFLLSKDCLAIRQQWARYGPHHICSLKYPRPNDYPARQGNLLVLKGYNPCNGEKGVLYLKFNESFLQFPALFDVSAIAEHYRVVLEPSTWGYIDEVFHLYVGRSFDVILQCQDQLDYDIINQMQSNLCPIHLGAGDWVDTDLFTPATQEHKQYDVIMIASWSKVKRHHILFKALNQHRLSRLKVALVGYAWDGRTRNDIEQEARKYGVLQQIDFFEQIPHSQVVEIIRKSKVAVMLTKREGANRALYECLLCGVPVVLYRHNRGVNRDIINSVTGRITDDYELGPVLHEMISNYAIYRSVADWATQNSGRKVAHRKLTACLQKIAEARGESYSEGICEIKAGNAAYVYDSDRKRMESEYARLAEYLRR